MDNGEDEALRAYWSRVGKVNARERRMRAMSDKELRAVTDELRARLQNNPTKEPESQEDRQPIPFRTPPKKDAPDDRQQ